MAMSDIQSGNLYAAMMFLETAFFSGDDSWTKLPEFRGMDESDLAGMAHGLIQFVASGHDSPQLQAARKVMAAKEVAMCMEEAAVDGIH